MEQLSSRERDNRNTNVINIINQSLNFETQDTLTILDIIALYHGYNTKDQAIDKFVKDFKLLDHCDLDTRYLPHLNFDEELRDAIKEDLRFFQKIEEKKGVEFKGYSPKEFVTHMVYDTDLINHDENDFIKKYFDEFDYKALADKLAKTYEYVIFKVDNTYYYVTSTLINR